MSNFVEPRDRDELEGSLLPVAHAVNEDTHEPTERQSAVPVTAATPVSYFAYPDDDEGESTADRGGSPQVVRSAPAVPLAHGGDDDDDEPPEERLVRQRLAEGQVAGCRDNAAQKQDIQKANRNVNAINYFTDRVVQAGTERARRMGREENQRGWAGPRSELAQKPSQPPTAKKKEEEGKDSKPKGTSGKGYEVEQYEVREYNTSDDYQISEYKSMYDN